MTFKAPRGRWVEEVMLADGQWYRVANRYVGRTPRTTYRERAGVAEFQTSAGDGGGLIRAPLEHVRAVRYEGWMPS